MRVLAIHYRIFYRANIPRGDQNNFVWSSKVLGFFFLIQVFYTEKVMTKIKKLCLKYLVKDNSIDLFFFPAK